MISPVKNPVMTSDYGPRTLMGKENFHKGVDLISREDATVRAILDGIVVWDTDDYEEAKRWTDPHHTAGNWVILHHQLGDTGFYTRYIHLVENYWQKGQNVYEGDILGKYGDVGYSFGAHLHIDFFTEDWKNFSPYDELAISIMMEAIKNGRYQEIFGE